MPITHNGSVGARLRRLTRDPKVLRALADEGFHWAVEIARVAEPEFVKRVAPRLNGDNDQAKRVHGRAQQINGAVMQAWANVHMAVRDPQFASLKVVNVGDDAHDVISADGRLLIEVSEATDLSFVLDGAPGSVRDEIRAVLDVAGSVATTDSTDFVALKIGSNEFPLSFTGGFAKVTSLCAAATDFLEQWSLVVAPANGPDSHLVTDAVLDPTALLDFELILDWSADVLPAPKGTS